MQNRFASYLSGYPVEQFGEKVDYLTNRSHDRNADWIAQHNRIGLIRELAEAWRMTGNEVYAKAAARHLDQWCDMAERNYQPGTLPIWNSLNSGVRGRNLSATIDLMLDYPALKSESLVTWLYILALHGDYLQNSVRTPSNWGSPRRRVWSAAVSISPNSTRAISGAGPVSVSRRRVSPVISVPTEWTAN